ncbi:MAG: hypothetical protein ACUVXA_03865 [Candidatus Jordarchaeum sp.]|uniref:hypothetical protein n=1 Tax=Candidatus Jordarchaeum sp. TaxID=2823881 RepID=UPI00404A16E8
MSAKEKKTGKKSKKVGEVKERVKRAIKPSYKDIIEEVYTTINWYATRFILFSIVGMVVGFIALVYGILVMYFINPLELLLNLNLFALQDVSVFLAVFIGFGSIVVSIILLAWGLFWRKKVDNRSIF